jgi:hypothetical protein
MTFGRLDCALTRKRVSTGSPSLPKERESNPWQRSADYCELAGLVQVTPLHQLGSAQLFETIRFSSRAAQLLRTILAISKSN